MADITFIFHKEWVDNIAHLSVDKQDAAIADMVRYGCKMELQHTDDDNAQTAVNFVKGKIDYSKDKYEQKIEAGKKNGGGNKKFTDKEIYELAQNYQHSQEIADILACSKSTIDHNWGWRERKKKDLEFDENGMIIV